MIPAEPPEVIRAAGGLVWRRQGGEPLLGVIHRARYGDWTLPKGKLEPGESWESAALREVKEELGCDAELEEFAGSVEYEVQGRPKVVRYWQMRVRGECDFQPSEEVALVEWLPVAEALRVLDHPGERSLLERIARG